MSDHRDIKAYSGQYVLYMRINFSKPESAVEILYPEASDDWQSAGPFQSCNFTANAMAIAQEIDNYQIESMGEEPMPILRAEWVEQLA